MESPLRLLPLECTQAHSHHEQNKIQTVTVNLTQCDCLYPCPFHITSLFHGLNLSVVPPSALLRRYHGDDTNFISSACIFFWREARNCTLGWHLARYILLYNSLVPRAILYNIINMQFRFLSVLGVLCPSTYMWHLFITYTRYIIMYNA
jgi:hypothetical protein